MQKRQVQSLLQGKPCHLHSFHGFGLNSSDSCESRFGSWLRDTVTALLGTTLSDKVDTGVGPANDLTVLAVTHGGLLWTARSLAKDENEYFLLDQPPSKLDKQRCENTAICTIQITGWTQDHRLQGKILSWGQDYHLQSIAFQADTSSQGRAARRQQEVLLEQMKIEWEQ